MSFVLLIFSTGPGCAFADMPEPADRSPQPQRAEIQMHQQPTYVADELLVKFKTGMFNRAALEAGEQAQNLLPHGMKQVLDSQNVSIAGMTPIYPTRPLPDPSREPFGFDRVYKITLQSTQGPVDLQALIQALKETGEIEYAEPNYIARTQTEVPPAL